MKIKCQWCAEQTTLEECAYCLGHGYLLAQTFCRGCSIEIWIDPVKIPGDQKSVMSWNGVAIVNEPTARPLCRKCEKKALADTQEMAR